MRRAARPGDGLRGFRGCDGFDVDEDALALLDKRGRAAATGDRSSGETAKPTRRLGREGDDEGVRLRPRLSESVGCDGCDRDDVGRGGRDE